VTGQIDKLRGLSEANFTGTQMSLGTGSDFKLITQEDLLPRTTAENWNTIKRNLFKSKYRVPDMNDIEMELETKLIIGLELTALTKVKKTIKSTKRKTFEESIKWGSIVTDAFPSSPKQARETNANVTMWNLLKVFAPSSP
jgi:hypothetical protein